MFNPLIDEIYSTQKVIGADDKPRDAFPVSLLYADGKALHQVITETKSLRTLEVGMAYGISTLFILQGLEDNGSGEHIAVDPYQKGWWEEIGKLNVARAGFSSSFRCCEAPSFMVLPQLLSEGKEFDFIFIDGNHRFEFTLVDYFFADRLLRVGGRIMFHDTWLPSIRKVLSFIHRNRSGYYAFDRRYCWGKRTGFAFLRAFLSTLRTAPLDIDAARLYASWWFANYCVLEKVAERDSETLDADWDFYCSF